MGIQVFKVELLGPKHILQGLSLHSKEPFSAAVEKKKNELNFWRLKFKVLKFVTLDRAIVGTTALYPAENLKGGSKSLCPTWSTSIRSQPPELFLLHIFLPKYEARALCQILKSHSTQIKEANKIIIIKGHAVYHPEKEYISNVKGDVY